MEDPLRNSDSPSYRRGIAFSWCLHDLANTIFSAIVVTVFLPLYVKAETGLAWPTGVIGTGTLIAAAVAVPLCGGVVDRTGRAKAYLVRSYLLYSLLAVGMSLAALTPLGVWGVLALFALANFLYQVSLVFYNSLLVVVAPPDRQGWISGLGVGLGYLGQPISLGIAFLVINEFGISWTFALAGVLVLGFSLPLQIWVPERTVEAPRQLSRQMLGEELKSVLDTLRSLRGHRNIAWFLAGNFLCVDVLNTSIFWASVLLVYGFGLEQGEMLFVIVIMSITAFGFGCASGWLTDRIGPKPAMLLAALSLFVSLIVLSATSNVLLVKVIFWTGGAAGLGGVWVSGRKLLLDLVPERRIGAYFGLYGLTNKGAAFGVAMFAILSDAWGYSVALVAAAMPLLLGMICISRVRIEGREYDDQEEGKRLKL